MTPREVINRLRREGWRERQGKGAHVVFTKDGRMTVVSNHPGDVPARTLRAICKQVGWDYPPPR